VREQADLAHLALGSFTIGIAAAALLDED